jgi:hypothetical protein
MAALATFLVRGILRRSMDKRSAIFPSPNGIDKQMSDKPHYVN